MRLSFVLLTVLVFAGCSSKKYFEPEQSFSTSAASGAYSSSIVNISRDGATLEDRRYIGNPGVSSLKLNEGYRFLSESPAYVLAANAQGVLDLIDKKTGKSVLSLSLEVPVVSATVSDGLIAYILNNNTFGLYRIKEKTKIIENRSGKTFAIDTRAASPMFIDNLVVMPMLDGKLVVLNVYDSENAKLIYLSSDNVFNNVVFLSRTGNTLVAATPKKIITIGNAGEYEFHANISEVAVSGGVIYLFSKEGVVVKLDKSLNAVTKKKFKFAQFSAATAFGGKVYALDQQGYLVVLSADLEKSKVYDIGSVDSPVFIKGSKLYKDGKVIELSTLGYE